MLKANLFFEKLDGLFIRLLYNISMDLPSPSMINVSTLFREISSTDKMYINVLRKETPHVFDVSNNVLSGCLDFSSKTNYV